MTSRSPEELWSLLLARATEITGAPGERLVDEDGDVQLADVPFGVWARLEPGAAPGERRLVFVVIPLMELTRSDALDEAVKAAIPGRYLHYEFGSGAIHLFGSLPPAVIEQPAAFRQAFETVLSTGKQVRAAIQPVFGGLTSEQLRVLRGWRGVNDEVEADLASILTGAGSTLLAHGWNPRRESPPLLCWEDRAEWAWANHLVTLEKGGGVRLRATVPGVRDGKRGFELTIHRLPPEAALAWASRLGMEKKDGPLETADVLSLADRPWKELWAATDGLPGERGDAWEEVG